MGDRDQFVTARAAAHRAGVAVVTMRRWLAEGRLPKYYRGPTRRVVVSVADLEAVLRVRLADDSGIEGDRT